MKFFKREYYEINQGTCSSKKLKTKYIDFSFFDEKYNQNNYIKSRKRLKLWLGKKTYIIIEFTKHRNNKKTLETCVGIHNLRFFIKRS